MNEEVKHASPFAVSSIAVQRSVALRASEDAIVFSAAIDKTAPEADKWLVMDEINALVERERLRVMLSQRQKALVIARKQPEQIDRVIAQLQAERMAFIGVRQSRHDRNDRRLPYEMSEVDKVKCREWENKIAAEEQNRAEAIRTLPLVEWEVESIKAGMAGLELPPRPPGFEEIVSEMQPHIEAMIAAIRAGAG